MEGHVTKRAPGEFRHALPDLLGDRGSGSWLVGVVCAEGCPVFLEQPIRLGGRFAHLKTRRDQFLPGWPIIMSARPDRRNLLAKPPRRGRRVAEPGNLIL